MQRLHFLILAIAGFAVILLGPRPAPGAVDADYIAGNVARIQGQAVAMQDASPRVLKPGDPVYIGDVLSTGEGARLEIRMIDDGLFTLSEKTVFVVIDYTFDGGGNAATRLMSGALKAVSGKLAKLETRPFRLQTEVATIGIRGTTIWVGDMPDGNLHVGLWSEGHVIVDNRAGRSEITNRGDGISVGGIDKSPGNAHPWPNDMNSMARSMVSFSR